jgi:16S rRNA (guanine966-N2)-methyltransferase
MADGGRVIAGSARGIRLRAPGGPTRPLGDRVKQTLFAILEPDLAGARVVDLFAGSGAAGIEALSRGAAAAWLVEIDPIAVRTIEENLSRTGLAGPRATVVHDDGLRWLAGPALAIAPVQVVIVDPPYARSDLLLAALERLGGPGEASVLAAGGLAVAKHFWRSSPPAEIGLLASDRTRRFGETALTFYRRRAAESEGA